MNRITGVNACGRRVGGERASPKGLRLSGSHFPLRIMNRVLRDKHGANV